LLWLRKDESNRAVAAGVVMSVHAAIGNGHTLPPIRRRLFAETA
jgi:hypothetical protein